MTWRLRVDRTTASIAVGAVLLGILYMAAAAWVQSRFGDTVPSTSTLSTSGSSLKVWHDYLDRLGLRPNLLTDFDSLPPSSTIVMAAPFENPPTSREATRLAAWVRAGGRVVLVGLDAAAVSGALGRLGGDASADATSVVEPSFPGAYSSGVGSIVAGPGRLTLDSTDWVALYGDPGGAALASKRMGAGEVVWLADVTPVSSAWIGERDDARLAVQLAAAKGLAIYFDEYHHGLTSEVTAWTQLGPGGRAAILLLLAAAATLIVARGRRVGPAIDRVEIPAARGGAYIAQLAELYRIAGARSEALVSLEEGLGRALARRHGDRSIGLLRHALAARAIEASAALRAGGRIGKEEFVSAAALLRAARREVEGGNG